jgi:hypothetical protein
VRYEALVSEPAKECEKLCSFLDLSYDDVMLRFHEGRERVRPGRGAKSAWLRITSGLRDWRTEKPEAEVERFGSGGRRRAQARLRESLPNPVVRRAGACSEDTRGLRSGTARGRRPASGVLSEMNPYLFVVCCPTSGTTLLQRMLDAQPLVAVIDETTRGSPPSTSRRTAAWPGYWSTSRR